ncbi:NUDIX hydrolase [Parabacteroides sp. OttesenSCG-928-O15]|nr:NUDIX hydrolase [Parabacteroides sp. OttesenSCG-928-O15]
MKTNKAIVLFAQRIRSLAQNGLVYTKNEYDIERYTELLQISDAMVSEVTACDTIEVASSYLPAKEYVTPKVDIRAVVFNDQDQILLVRERSDGLWSLPGGWADVGFTPKEIAVKEVFEETGLKVHADRLLAVMDMREHDHPAIPFYVYKFFILCKPIGGVFTDAFDILDKGFFSIDHLPPLSLERVLPEQIRYMFDVRNNPEQAVYLD